MRISLICSNCRASFVVAGEPPPDVATCPECGTSQLVPTMEVPTASRENAAPSSGESVSVFIPSSRTEGESGKPRGWLKLASLGLGLVLIAGILASWPQLKRTFWKSEPTDPVERVARSYLEALIHEEADEIHRLGTIEEPPAIRSFGEMSRVRDLDQTLKGKFGPIARLNKQIDDKFSFDPKIGRFTPKNPLGAAGETLDALHEAKENAEKSGIYEKMASGDPNDVFDAAEGFAKVYARLAEGALAPKRILPTYPMLIKDAKPQLSANEKELALDYGENQETWDALLKRPFLTLKADGPYVLDRAEVVASVQDKLASLGDPPSTLRLKLVRFRLEGIDTGWKVISARRDADDSRGDDSTLTGSTGSETAGTGQK